MQPSGRLIYRDFWASALDLDVTSLREKHIGASNLERHSGGGLRRRLARKTSCRIDDQQFVISRHSNNTSRMGACSVDVADLLR